MNNKVLMCLLIFSVCFQVLMAQKKVTGTVKDTSGDSILGAGVLEKGTRNEVATDLDGNYTLSVKERAILEFSSPGFETQDISTDGKITINVVLQEKVIQLAAYWKFDEAAGDVIKDYANGNDAKANKPLKWNPAPPPATEKYKLNN